MGLDDQPDEEAGGEVQGAGGARSYVDLKTSAGFYTQGDHCAAGFDGFDSTGQNIACAEEVRGFGGDEDVAGANGYAHFCAGRGVTQGNFDFAGGVIERDAHDAVGGQVFDDDRGENIFKTGGVGKFDAARCFEDGPRGAGFLDASVYKCDDALADGVDFLAIVCDVENGDAVGFVPGAQVFEDGAAQRGVETGERLVEEQEARKGDQRTGEGNALIFSAGEFRRTAGQKFLDAERFCDPLHAFRLLGGGKFVEPVADVSFDRKMREESERLKNVGEFAPLRREREIAGSVKQDFLAEADFAGVGLLQAGNAIEQRGFPRAGGPE